MTAAWGPDNPCPFTKAKEKKQAVRITQDMILELVDIDKEAISDEVIANYIFGTVDQYKAFIEPAAQAKVSGPIQPAANAAAPTRLAASKEQVDQLQAFTLKQTQQLTTDLTMV